MLTHLHDTNLSEKISRSLTYSWLFAWLIPICSNIIFVFFFVIYSYYLYVELIQYLIYPPINWCLKGHNFKTVINNIN